MSQSFKDLFRAGSRNCDGGAIKSMEMAEAQFFAAPLKMNFGKK